MTDSIANLQRLEYVVTEVDRRVNIETKFYQIISKNFLVRWYEKVRDLGGLS